MKLSSCVLFREVACHHVRLQSSDVIQVDVLRPLVLTPLPHHWHRESSTTDNLRYECLTFVGQYKFLSIYSTRQSYCRWSTFPLADDVWFATGLDVWETLCHVA